MAGSSRPYPVNTATKKADIATKRQCRSTNPIASGASDTRTISRRFDTGWTRNGSQRVVKSANLPKRCKHGLGADFVNIRAIDVHEGTGADSPFIEVAHEPRHSDSHSVLHLRVIEDIGNWAFAVRRRHDRPRHGLVEWPVFDVDDHVDHQGLPVHESKRCAVERHLIGKSRVGHGCGLS